MALYLIGDIQGCNAALQRLLDTLAFSPSRDTLYILGDLVNRGPDSLGCLRYVKSLGETAVTVLAEAARTRFLTKQVADTFRRGVQVLADKKAGEPGVTLDAARQYAENGMSEELFQRTAQWVLPMPTPEIPPDVRDQYRVDPVLMASMRDDLSRTFSDNFANAVVDAESEQVKRQEPPLRKDAAADGGT